MKTINKLMLLAIVAGTLFTACSKESTSIDPDPVDDGLKIEGVLEGSEWVVEKADLPESVQANYDRIEFSVEENQNYVWNWIGSNGNDYRMTGSIYQEKSASKHDNGAGLWNIYVYVTHINGQELPGGFYGIYSYEDENHLLMNVEPDVQNWGDHPEADKGIGSGQSGMESVYKFTKK